MWTPMVDGTMVGDAEALEGETDVATFLHASPDRLRLWLRYRLRSPSRLLSNKLPHASKVFVLLCRRSLTMGGGLTAERSMLQAEAPGRQPTATAVCQRTTGGRRGGGGE